MSEANRLQNQLQQRWARISIQRAVLFRADQIFSASDRRSQASADLPSKVQARLRIGKHDYDVTLSDEQAKWNLLAALRHGDSKIVQSAIAESGLRLKLDQLEVIANQLRNAPSIEFQWPARSYQAWFEELDRPNLAALRSAPSRFSEVTLWGDGKLNWKRATTRQILWQGQLHNIHRDLVAALASRKAARATPGMDQTLLSFPSELQNAFSDTSDCFALWIFPVGNNPSETTFSVRQKRIGGVENVEGMAW